MDVTFVCSGEEPFKMEVGFFDTVQDIKQKLLGCKGWPATALSLFHNRDVLADVDVDGAGGVTERYGIVKGARCGGAVIERCGSGRAEVAVGARCAVSANPSQELGSHISSSYSCLLDLATGAADQGPPLTSLGALRRWLPSVVTTLGLIDDSPAVPSILLRFCRFSVLRKSKHQPSILALFCLNSSPLLDFV